MKIIALAVALSVGGVAYAQEKPDSPKPKVASEMTPKERDAYLLKKYPGIGPFKYEKEVSSVREAALTPGMLVFEGMFVASTVMDIEGTQHCIASHVCREADPLLGQSRTQAYLVSASFDVVAIYSAAWLRKKNHPGPAVFLLWLGTTGHTVAAVQGWRR